MPETHDMRETLEARETLDIGDSGAAGELGMNPCALLSAVRIIFSKLSILFLQEVKNKHTTEDQ